MFRERKLLLRKKNSVSGIRVFVVAHIEECLAGAKNEVVIISMPSNKLKIMSHIS